MATLRDAIYIKHRQAEQMLFNQRMVNGELSKFEYALYLYQVKEIFFVLDKVLADNNLPYELMRRTYNVLDDFMELYADMPIDEIERLKLVDGIREYSKHLRGLNTEDALAHVYLNYLALMFGGRLIGSKVPGSGTLYKFDDIHACISAMREIQRDSFADEANKGLDFHIRMYDELQRISKQYRPAV
jgi:hypothetical protein